MPLLMDDVLWRYLLPFIAMDIILIWYVNIRENIQF